RGFAAQPAPDTIDALRQEITMTSRAQRLVRAALAAATLSWLAVAQGQPTFGNPSPTAGKETSQKANAAADQAAYQPVGYTNVNKKGPALVVLPGGVKSNNATFMQKFTPNNIADFGEAELSAANFQVVERANRV